MQNRFGQHIPDILDSLAQLSNDEVPTPPRLANAMLDLLPAEVWTNPDYVWLDPFCKSGIFLREAARRLLESLSDWEPDFEKRRDHIFRKMLYGTAITEVTGLIARRSLYRSKDASGSASFVQFDTADGHLPFIQSDHTFRQGKCEVCGAPEELERGSKRENYAYSFIHGTYPTQEMQDMKFDVIVGNPPYQIDSDGNTRTMPIYQKFVEQAIALAPRHLVMITPSRWFAGGLGLDQFRARMLADHRLSHVVDFPQSKDAFPGVKIRGGVSYFCWSRDHAGDCEVKTVRGSSEGPPMRRKLDAYDVFVRYNEAVTILDKVRSVDESTMESTVSSLVPFGLRAKFRDYVSAADPAGIDLHIMGRKVERIDRSSVTNNVQWIDKHKTLLHAAYGEDHDGPYAVIASPIVAEPPSACTETYLVIGAYDTAEEARNLDRYLRTRFVRFLVWLRMNTQHVSKDRFAFVPVMPSNRAWTDADLYERYGLDDVEVDFINTTIREMPLGASEIASESVAE